MGQTPMQQEALQMWKRALSDIGDAHEMLANLGPTYAEAYYKEMSGTAVPLIEPKPDFALEKKFHPGEVKASSETIAPFCRVWSFERAGQKLDAQNIIIYAPNSGTQVQHMRAAVHALLPLGNVRLVEQRDPHYVPAQFKNGHDESNAASIEVARRYPHSHLIGFSQSGGPATIAAALADAASLTVIGSPINPALAPDSMNWMAKWSFGDPPFIRVGPSYPGAGRLILPGTIPKLMFEKAPADSRAHMRPQALPAEHIRDTMGRVFRDYLLPRGKYPFKGNIVRTEAITCHVQTFAGKLDRICPPPQTHHLHRMTPNAASHVKETIDEAGHYKLVGIEVLEQRIAPAIAKLMATRAPTPQLVAV